MLVVVFPSPAMDEVTSTEALASPTCAYRRFVRSRRNASPRGLWGGRSVTSGVRAVEASDGTAVRTGARVIRRSVSLPRSRVSSAERSSAAPTPNTIPTTRPRSVSIHIVRLLGSTGGSAASATERTTGEVPSPAGFSSVVTTSTRLVATASAMRAAARGDSSVTAMPMSTVFGSDVACTRFARSLGVSSRLSASTTGPSTARLSAMSTYVCMRSCVNVEPCWRSVADPEFTIDTKSCVCAVYVVGARNPTPSPPSAPTTAAAMMSATCCRRTRR